LGYISSPAGYPICCHFPLHCNNSDATNAWKHYIVLEMNVAFLVIRCAWSRTWKAGEAARSTFAFSWQFIFVSSTMLTLIADIFLSFAPHLSVFRFVAQGAFNHTVSGIMIAKTNILHIVERFENLSMRLLQRRRMRTSNSTRAVRLSCICY